MGPGDRIGDPWGPCYGTKVSKNPYNYPILVRIFTNCTTSDYKYSKC